MRLGLRLPLGPDCPTLVRIAQEAQRVQCDSVWVSDHLVWPASVASKYPYAAGGAAPVSDDTPFLDPLLVLAGIAVATDRLKVATGVFVLPLRETLATARAVATLDSLSDGRAIFGVGLGWMREEFDAAGATFDDRAERADEQIEALRLLWQPGAHGFAGHHVRFPPVHLSPSPPQGSALPIHVGGETPQALRRAARLGDGWISMAHDPDTARRRIADLSELRSQYGRSASPFEVSILAPWPTSPEMIDGFRRAGATRVLVYPWESLDWRSDLEQVAELMVRCELLDSST
jgi:probable F420-dependent oxidoreductase